MALHPRPAGDEPGVGCQGRGLGIDGVGGLRGWQRDRRNQRQRDLRRHLRLGDLHHLDRPDIYRKRSWKRRNRYDHTRCPHGIRFRYPATVNYTIGNASQTYGSPTAFSTLPGTIDTGVNSQNLTITYGSTGDSTTADVLAGGYAITGTVSDGSGSASDYDVKLTNGTLTVNKADQTIQWSTPAAIAVDTPLSGLQLDAVASGVTGGSVLGTLTYQSQGVAVQSGTILPAGLGQPLTVTAAATTDYNQATATV